MTFRFVLCADDFALTEGVSRGILDLLGAGRLTAAGAMTNRPAWPRLARDLVAHAGTADLGVHITLTLGRALGPVPGFAPDAPLPPLGAVVRFALTGRLPRDALAAEIGRQLDAFAQAVGAPPDFVDGHQHVHALPGVREALFDALEPWRALAPRLYLRDPADGARVILARRVAAAKALGVAALAAGFGARARAAGWATNVGFAGFSGFDPAGVGAVTRAALAAPGPRHLVMCHPGRADAELGGLDPVTGARDAELAYFAGPAFQADLAARGATLARFGELEGSGPSA